MAAASLSPASEALIVLQGDQPFVDRAMLRRLLGEWRERQFEIRDVSTLQAVEHRADIDERIYLLPPMRAANKPTQKWWEDFSTVRTQQDEVLP